MLAMTIERRLQSKGVRIEITYRGVVGRSGTVDLYKSRPCLAASAANTLANRNHPIAHALNG